MGNEKVVGGASINKMPKFVEQIYRNEKDYKGIVFLDRDGTINQQKVGYLQSTTQIKLLPTVAEGIRKLNKNKIAVVIITNQPVVARGYITIEVLKKINDSLVVVLKKKNAYINAIYSCPHHPEKNHPDIPKSAMKYRIKCSCRKPGLAMFKLALSVFGSPKMLGVIGDQTKDILAGKKLKIPTAIVKTGYKGEDGLYDVAPDFICDNFLTAVRVLLKNFKI